MEWINTEEKLPEAGQQIEMTCNHWESNWKGSFDSIYLSKGSYDEFGNFWDSEGCRLHSPSYWRPYQPERSKREDLGKEDYDLADFINGKIDWTELKMRCSEHCGNTVRDK
jgi:hypothetical protein